MSQRLPRLKNKQIPPSLNWEGFLFLTKGSLLCTNTKVFAGLDAVTELARADSVPAAYTHPSTKQCNYSVDTSGIEARLEVVENKVNNIAGSNPRWTFYSIGTWTCSSSGYYTICCIGGGGGCAYYNDRGANGGTGYINTITTYISSGASYSITIGSGGSGESVDYRGGSASSGTSSSVGSLLTSRGGGGGLCLPYLGKYISGEGSRQDGYGYQYATLAVVSRGYGTGGTVEQPDGVSGIVMIW